MFIIGQDSIYNDKFPTFASKCGMMNSPKKAEAKKTEKLAEAKRRKDVYKDTPLRMMGFTNELGTAVSELCFSSRGIMKHIPALSYIPAVLYIGADSYDKYKRGIDGTYEKPSIKTGARELMSQMVTSVLAPTGVVLATQKGVKKLAEKLGPKMPNGIKDAGKKAVEFLKTNKVTKNIIKNNDMAKKAAVVGISLVALVCATKPIDKMTEKLFEKTVDPILFRNKTKKDKSTHI